MHRAAVECDALDPAMRGEQDRAARRFVYSARVHPDETVLDKIEPADDIVMAELVQPGQKGSGRQSFAIDRNRITAIEMDGDRRRLFRRVLGRNGTLMHI